MTGEGRVAGSGSSGKQDVGHMQRSWILQFNVVASRLQDHTGHFRNANVPVTCYSTTHLVTSPPSPWSSSSPSQYRGKESMSLGLSRNQSGAYPKYFRIGPSNGLPGEQYLKRSMTSLTPCVSLMYAKHAVFSSAHSVKRSQLRHIRVWPSPVVILDVVDV